eukprot:5725503-Amphidinium_carterae.1
MFWPFFGAGFGGFKRVGGFAMLALKCGGLGVSGTLCLVSNRYATCLQARQGLEAASSGRSCGSFEVRNLLGRCGEDQGHADRTREQKL